MKASKENKVYTIEEKQKEQYQDSGFDIYGNDGELVAYGRGKTVPYEKFAAVAARNAVLKKELQQAKEQLTAVAKDKPDARKKG